MMWILILFLGNGGNTWIVLIYAVLMNLKVSGFTLFLPLPVFNARSSLDGEYAYMVPVIDWSKSVVTLTFKFMI